MSTAKIDKFNEAKERLRVIKRYFDVFDQPGHMNQAGRVATVTVSSFTVYHQAYAGANNYHEADECLRNYISSALVGMGEHIRRAVIAKLEAELASAAAAAKAEAEAVLQAVG